MATTVQRRDVMAALGGAAAVPIFALRAAHAQQRAMPVIGFLDTRSPDSMANRLRAMREGLKDTGYIEGENVAIEYRWAENQVDRLPGLAADLVRRRVALILTSGGRDPAFAVWEARICRSRRADELRVRHCRGLSPDRPLRRSYP